LFKHFLGFFGLIRADIGPYGPLWASMGPAQALEEREKFKRNIFILHNTFLSKIVRAHMGPARTLEKREKLKKKNIFL